MPCPSAPVPVTIVAQHGPDQVGVVSSIGTGAQEAAVGKAPDDRGQLGAQQVETDSVHSDDQHVA